MKKRMLIGLILGFLPVFFIAAQEKAKFGKITPEELTMTVYENDSTASAVVLYEEMYTRYEYDQYALFRVVNQYFVRIKILTDEGLSQADRSIHKYVGNTRQNSEILSGLSGFTYNMENGNIEKVKLSKEHIFEEKVSDYLVRVKFAFQSVKPGSVIEYKYELSSPRNADLNDYYFQRSIPVKYSRFYLQIPEYFSFSKEIKGMERVTLKQTKENKTMFVGSSSMNYTADIYDFEAEDLPGLKDESYVWFVGDFLARVTFELSSFIIPGVVHKQYNNSWRTVEETLINSNGFGKQFDHKLFKTELATLFTPEMTETDKVRAVYNMVRSKVAWNDKNTMWVKNPKDALKKGMGTSGEINALLICALREAGFDAYPVVMRLRNTGRPPISHPTIDNLNYFIVAVTAEGKPVYLDASAKYGDLNVMASGCLSDFARNIFGPAGSGWVDLSSISKSMEVMGVMARFNEEGILSGEVQISKSNELAYDFRTAYEKYKDEQEFFDERAAAAHVDIPNHEILNLKETDKKVQLKFSYTKKEATTGDEYIYLNPIIFPLYEENPFKAESRKLPVEFNYPFEKRINAVFDIPEGYVVDGLPESIKISFSENNDASYQYMINEDKNTRKVMVNLRLTLNRIIYLQPEYEILRNFFLHLTTSNNEQIVLKKITQ